MGSGSRPILAAALLSGLVSTVLLPAAATAQSRRPDTSTAEATVRTVQILDIGEARAPRSLGPARSPAGALQPPTIDRLDALREPSLRTRRAATRYFVDSSTPETTNTRPAGYSRNETGTTSSADVGDTLSFNTPNILSGAWNPTHFTVVAEATNLRLWVATTEWNDGDVTQSDVEALVDRLTTSTPAESHRPSSGILEINAELFGTNPDYDGDDVLDILWYDIRDNYLGEGSEYAPVVVTLDDTNPDAEAGIGNQADIIYLDTTPTLTAEHTGGLEEVEASVAGGHVSLIQIGNDRNEVAFIRVGLLEIGKVMNGYEQSPADYLTQPIEHNIPMLSFGGFLGDRQRGELLMRYAVDQFGVESIGFLARDSSNAEVGLANMIDSVDAPITVSELVANFHTANFLNNRSIDARYGYSDERLSDVGAVPTFKVDASLFGSTPSGSALVESGGVVYAQWENVSDLEIAVDAMNSAERGFFSLRAVVEPAGGSAFVTDLTPSATPVLFPGAYERVTLIIVHSDLTSPAARIVVGADWSTTAYPTVNVIQDDATLADVPYNFILLGTGWIQAVRFDMPNASALKKVFLRPFFRNQFIDPDTGQLGGPPGAPRDLTLIVLADDGFGLPGDTLHMQTFTDPTPYSPFIDRDLTSTFVEVDFGPDRSLAVGQNVVYVGLSESGNDTNWLALALAGYEPESTSLLFGPIASQPPQWWDLWDLTADEVDLDGLTIPIRAQFQVPEPVAVEDASRVSTAAIEILGVYPNPARNTAEVTLTTRDRVPVSLTVFDLLGRRVWRSAERASLNGSRDVHIDVGNVGAGLYILTAELPDGTRATSRFVIL